MSENEQIHDDSETEAPQGHAMGIVDSASQCAEVVQALVAKGFRQKAMTILNGAEGADQLKELMQGSLWGEAAENFQREGLNELKNGHSVLVVDVKNVEAAHLVSQVASHSGGHTFYHFGLLEDVRLTQ